jgi:hypothetical protein
MGVRAPPTEVGLHMTDLLEGSGDGPMTGDVRLECDAPHDIGLGGIIAEPVRRKRRRLKGGRSMRGLLAGVLVVTLLCAPSIGFAGEKAADVSRESGLGAAAAISSLIYGPVKLVYAVGGLVVGSFAWVFTAGDSKVAETVFTRSLRGDYVITPGILVGDEPLEFIGRDVEPYRPKTEAVASAEIPPVVDESGYDEMGW